MSESTNAHTPMHVRPEDAASAAKAALACVGVSASGAASTASTADEWHTLAAKLTVLFTTLLLIEWAWKRLIKPLLNKPPGG